MRPSGIGSRIRQARIASGLKPADLARAAGLPASSISRLELGRQRTAPETLSLLAQFLGVSAAYLGTKVRHAEAELMTGARLLKILTDTQKRLELVCGLSPGRVELILTFRQGGVP